MSSPRSSELEAARTGHVRAVLGIGSNQGDRLATMREAVRRIAAVASIRAVSRVFETAPVGGPPQGPFLNAAILVECTCTPLHLLDALQRIEADLGRDRGPDSVVWGPRSIDLDILWIDGLSMADERLTVPHPRLHERAFALVPMLEIAPHAVDPRTGEPFAAPPVGDVRPTAAALDDD